MQFPRLIPFFCLLWTNNTGWGVWPFTYVTQVFSYIQKCQTSKICISVYYYINQFVVFKTVDIYQFYDDYSSWISPR
jgi:hypothetical protein